MLNNLLIIFHKCAGVSFVVEGCLPVALLSSDACELAPLRIVLLCVFLPILYFFTSLFDTCIVCNDYVRQKNTFGHWTALH